MLIYFIIIIYMLLLLMNIFIRTCFFVITAIPLFNKCVYDKNYLATEKKGGRGRAHHGI